METPHVFILSCSGSTCLLVQACLFGKQCLASQCSRCIHDAHACSIHTKEFGCFSEENGFPPSRLLPVPQTHADSRPLFLLLESYFRCKSVSFWRVLTPLAIPEYFWKKLTNGAALFLLEEETQRVTGLNKTKGKMHRERQTERAASFKDQSIIIACNESSLSSLKFLWYKNPEF